MPTPAECWHRAETLIKLAAMATQLYAREMLLERAAEFGRWRRSPRKFRRGHTMSERAIQESRSWTSDLVAVVLYSVVVVLLLLSWVYIPA